MNIPIRKAGTRTASGLSYNAGGYPVMGNYNMRKWKPKFPEIKYTGHFRYIVSLLYRITEDGRLYDLAVEDGFVNQSLFPKYKLATSSEFREEAMRVTKLIPEWIPHSYNGRYVDREGRMTVPFDYHPEYFNAQSEKVELNPDVIPEFIGANKDVYERYTNPKTGFDGVVEFLVIVESDGRITHEQCLNTAGKTNCEYGLAHLNQLNSWKPGMKAGVAIRTQMKIVLYTQ